MIKFNLVKFEKELIFQILEQTIQSNNLCSYGIYVNYDGINYGVKSITSPDLNYFISNKVIYIRGSDKFTNFKKCSINFETNAQRDYYYDMILYILKKAFSNELLIKCKSHTDLEDDINFYNYI
jgi:hypothetical protein